MSKKGKPWLEKEVEYVENKDTDEEEIKVNWGRILLLGFITSAVFIFIDIIYYAIFYFW